MNEQGTRLSKRMVELGLCSRREADEYIEQGLVSVDGTIVRILGSRVEPQQRIELARPDTVLHDARVTLLIHQPAGLTSGVATLIKEENRSPDDHSGIAFSPRHRRQLLPSTPLDQDTSGLTVLTQDKRLAERLAECEMEFLIAVEQAPTTEALQQASQQMSQEGLVQSPFKITRQSDRQLRFVLHAPQPQQIGLMSQRLGVSPLSVRCIRIGRIAVGKLQPGQWRYLRSTERF